MDVSSANTQIALMKTTQGPDINAVAKRALNETKLGTKEMERIDAAAKDFEAMFISEMMKPMFEGIETSGYFGGGKGEEIFRGMLVQEYGKQLAESGQIGMADSIKTELIKMQEDANDAASQ